MAFDNVEPGAVDTFALPDHRQGDGILCWLKKCIKYKHKINYLL